MTTDNNEEKVDIDLDAEFAISEPDMSMTGKIIMIVDDDNFLLEMYAKKFQNAGFEIQTATDGLDALEKIDNGSNPDILLFDLIMPQMDGLELITQIKEKNIIPNSLKIILSNQGQQSDIDNAEKLGIDGYIVKAMHTPSEIVDIVSKIYKAKK